VEEDAGAAPVSCSAGVGDPYCVGTGSQSSDNIKPGQGGLPVWSRATEAQLAANLWAGGGVRGSSAAGCGEQSSKWSGLFARSHEPSHGGEGCDSATLSRSFSTLRLAYRLPKNKKTTNQYAFDLAVAILVDMYLVEG
jgi:hypothetical protein